MVVLFWSAAGGAGTTVVATATALLAAASADRPALLVDLAGDAPACLGVAEPAGPGLAAWSATAERVRPDALERLICSGGRGLDLLPRGTGRLEPGAMALLGQLLAVRGGLVVIDAGRLVGGGARALAEQATHRLLVTRACVLALRRAQRAPIRPTGVVVTHERGRAISAPAAAEAVGVPLVAEVPADPAIARAADAGMAASRLPRPLQRALVPVLAAVGPRGEDRRRSSEVVA